MQESALTHLASHPYGAQLHRAWQLIKHQAQRDNQRPDVHFKSELLPAYQHSEISDIHRGYSEQWHITTGLTALSGAKALMPRNIYRDSLQAVFEEGNETLVDFFNGFNNRYYRLYCQTELKNDLSSQMEEETFSWNGYGHSISEMLAHLNGSVEETKGIPQSHFIQYTGMIGLKITCPNALEEMLEEYFEYPFEVGHASADYQPISPDSHTAIGIGGKNRELGFNALLGKSTVMVGQKLDVKIKPKTYEQYTGICQDRNLPKAISQMVKHYMGINLKFRLLMKVNGQYLPNVQLSGDAQKGQKLGQSVWIADRQKESTYVEMPLKGQ